VWWPELAAPSQGRSRSLETGSLERFVELLVGHLLALAVGQRAFPDRDDVVLDQGELGVLGLGVEPPVAGDVELFHRPSAATEVLAHGPEFGGLPGEPAVAAAAGQCQLADQLPESGWGVAVSVPMLETMVTSGWVGR
jgi:hypothetical protein